LKWGNLDGKLEVLKVSSSNDIALLKINKKTSTGFMWFQQRKWIPALQYLLWDIRLTYY
jgi:hypothetical protein